jgi:hypothetical protein
MMPVIRISEGTWEKLKEHAVPLEDTVDDVISRALDALDGTKRAAPKAGDSSSPRTTDAGKRATRRGTKLPQKAFRTPLLETIYELGGRAPTKKVQEIMAKKMAPQLSEADYATVTSGDERWWNAICWERNDLVKEGLFRADSDRGVWELSDKGVKLVEATRAR